MKIRSYHDSDWTEWLRLSVALFPEDSAATLAPEMGEFRSRPDAEVFVAERADGTLAGFVEVATRPYADGCDTSPVGYIEAWYVDPDARRQQHGRALMAAAEAWALARGYREMASDALLENTVSHAAHKRLGYDEVGRVVQFRKVLPDAQQAAATAMPNATT
jgi:aminoglycoside 6'-N-acetyltransferase I